MEHLAAMEDRLVTDRLRRKLEEVNAAAQNHLSPVQDHVNFTLQQAYFKCAYECFDRRRKQEEINNCVEHCSVPVLNVNNFVEAEMAKFQERLNRSLMVCQDKFEASKLQKIKTDARNDLESCVNEAINDSLATLPHVVDRIKSSLSMN
ncbi:protein FAM136A [Canna indica]|uniref:Protein FAM136A n=1 Tax=Canna indica TaxID=4628 RepID=A0AAQ3KME3_9LILI|nr:protein FAM136A [Canna indica]